MKACKEAGGNFIKETCECNLASTTTLAPITEKTKKPKKN
jgi:hypothetical protein